jgi:hypothetical protein
VSWLQNADFCGHAKEKIRKRFTKDSRIRQGAALPIVIPAIPVGPNRQAVSALPPATVF